MSKSFRRARRRRWFFPSPRPSPHPAAKINFIPISWYYISVATGDAHIFSDFDNGLISIFKEEDRGNKRLIANCDANGLDHSDSTKKYLRDRCKGIDLFPENRSTSRD